MLHQNTYSGSVLSQKKAKIQKAEFHNVSVTTFTRFIDVATCYYNNTLKDSFTIKIASQKAPVSTPLGARPGVGTQPRYEAASDIRVKIATKQ